MLSVFAPSRLRPVPRGTIEADAEKVSARVRASQLDERTTEVALELQAELQAMTARTRSGTRRRE